MQVRRHQSLLGGENLRLELGRLGAILLCVVIGGSAAFLTDSSEDVGRIDYGQALLIKTVALFALMLLLWLSVLEKDERQRFERWVRERPRPHGRSGDSAA